MPEKILVYVVDDDEAVRESTLALLASEDIAAEGFATPNTFLAAFDAARAGCLLFDVHMPEMNGFELLALLRRRRMTTPAFLLTGRGDPSMADTAARLGATVMAKPVDGVELITAVQAALRRPRLV